MSGELGGLHHVSALSAEIGASHEFYTRVLGLRPVIRSVNQDATGMYHLFFGDGRGSPGSDMTVFDMAGAVRERRGNRSITRTTFRVGGGATLDFWAERLRAEGVVHGGVRERDGRGWLEFDDVVGTALALVDDGGTGETHPWAESPVAPEHQIRGLGLVEITVPELSPTDAFLKGALGLRHDRTYAPAESPRQRVHVYAMGKGGAHAEIHVRVDDELPPARYGSGGVHHLALRVPGLDDIGGWADHLTELGLAHSGVVDRHYFRSVYVREPNGVLFELATDGPGFEVDGPLDGERLSLPPFLEPRRAAIEAGLKPLRV